MDKRLFILKRFFLILVQSFLITGITLVAVIPFSCKISPQGIQIIGGNYSIPKLQEINVESDEIVELKFSEGVNIKNLVISPFIENVSNSTEISLNTELSLAIKTATDKNRSLKCSVNFEDENKTVKIIIDEKTEIGKKYEIYGVVEDKIGNSLTFCVPFIGYNSKIPKLLITEIHPAMASQNKNDKEKNVRRVEYVKFLALTDGNLSGLKFCSGLYGESKDYDFPAVEVKSGEFFTLHLREKGDGCISEEGEDFTLAFAPYTSKFLRDLWRLSDDKSIGDKKDILVVKNSITGELYDAIMYSDGSFENWSNILKTDFTLHEDFSKIYKNCKPENAFSSKGIGTTKVFARKNISEILENFSSVEDFSYTIENSSEFWEITTSSLLSE